MVFTDREILERIILDDRAALERVINAGGVPYSTINVDGYEMLSCPTEKEEEMVEYYKKNKKLVCGE